ncbi:hypothetical protein ACFLFF_30310 [Brevibacillus reuszeri]|uniref:hypothetical protein n=1 Tax=Brevibacillus reuszeri TaxID=54915 RepID=UPI0036712C01
MLKTLRIKLYLFFSICIVFCSLGISSVASAENQNQPIYIFNSNGSGCPQTVDQAPNMVIDQKQVETKEEPISSTTPQTLWDKFIAGIIGGFIPLVIFYLNRRQARKQLVFDISLKSLLPDVYLPLIKELKQHQDTGRKLDFAAIQKVIVDNAALINFAPKNIKAKINEIYTICKLIKNPESYNQFEGELINYLKELDKLIMKRFEGFIG